LAKFVFEVHGVDGHGKMVLCRTLRRGAVTAFFANLPPCLVGMEASNGAHFWAKAISELGHEVRLISPQFVKPYVKSNKNDRNDAEAICESVGRPNMRFVPIKSAEQLAVQAVHRIRSRLVADRVRFVNQIRGLLGEHGTVVAKDISNLRRALVRIVDDDGDRGLNKLVRSLMGELRQELTELDARIADYDRKIRELYRSSEVCQRLGKIEGIGPVTATALVQPGQRQQYQSPINALILTSLDSRSKDIRILAIIIAELELGNSRQMHLSSNLISMGRSIVPMWNIIFAWLTNALQVERTPLDFGHPCVPQDCGRLGPDLLIAGAYCRCRLGLAVEGEKGACRRSPLRLWGPAASGQ
jgi:hypothetical protein